MNIEKQNNGRTGKIKRGQVYTIIGMIIGCIAMISDSLPIGDIAIKNYINCSLIPIIIVIAGIIIRIKVYNKTLQ